MVEQKNRIRVTADDRERRSEVVNCLSEMEDVDVIADRLSAGDYIVDDRLVFERKTLKDLARSIVDGRLFRQAIRLANSRYRAVLVLEGTGKDVTKAGVGREALQGALITVGLLLGVTILRSKGPMETANLIAYAGRQIRSSARAGFQRRGYQPKGKRSRQLFILQALPGVGIERAIRLLEAFGSVEAVITATREELQTVYGIGEKIAARIKWAVREQVQPFGFID